MKGGGFLRDALQEDAAVRAGIRNQHWRTEANRNETFNLGRKSSNIGLYRRGVTERRDPCKTAPSSFERWESKLKSPAKWGFTKIRGPFVGYP